MTTQEHETFTKRRLLVERASAVLKDLGAEIKELETMVVQYDNKVQAQERVIMARKGEIAELEAKIRLKSVEANSSNLAVRDELDKRHAEVLTKESAIKVREDALREKEMRVSALLDKAERVNRAAEAAAA